MKKEEIIVCVTNHNYNENSIKHKEEFLKIGIESYIIDSGSEDTLSEFDILLPNVYYNGLLNESIKLTINKNKKYMLFVAGDVFIDNYIELIDNILVLEDDVYLYSPSSRGRSHPWCKKNILGNSIRDVIFVEGFMFLSHIDLINVIYPIDISINKYGYGVDVLLGYITYTQFKKRCVIDDRIEVYHTEKIGYTTALAVDEMNNWIDTLTNEQIQYLKRFFSGGYSITDRLLKELLKLC